MITAGSVQNYRYQAGAGFAVPATTALGIVDRIRSGQAGSDILLGQPGYVGIAVSELNPSAASVLGVAGGVSVTGVAAGSPAAGAGLPVGAVITQVGGSAVNSVAEFGLAIHRHHPGESLAVSWVDAAGSHSVKVVLVGGPAV